jgi:hypothetical protein
MHISEEKFPAYFWSKVERRPRDECWPWLASRRMNGYGQIHFQRKGLLAHRVAWTLTNGPIPDGLCVCHRCDNPACCRPDHLFLATNADNSADMVAKRRQNTTEPFNRARGERSGRAKLSDPEVADLRRLYAEGVGPKILSERFGISRTHVHRIVSHEYRQV